MSNPETGALLERTVRLIRKALREPVARRVESTPGRARHGAVERACITAIVSSGSSASLKSIHAEVEALIGGSISYSSVKNAVARLARADGSLIKRIGPGVYRAWNG